jgi:hypothetical protein
MMKTKWKTSKGHGRGQSWMNYDTGKLRLQITKYGSKYSASLSVLPMKHSSGSIFRITDISKQDADKIKSTLMTKGTDMVVVQGIRNKYKKNLKEGNIGITTKKGKTIELTHKKSGKEIVVTNTPSTLKKYAKMGYLISMPEGVIPRNQIKKKMSEKEWKKIKKGDKHIGHDGTHYILRRKSMETVLVPVIVEGKLTEKALKTNPKIWVSDKFDKVIDKLPYSKLTKDNIIKLAKKFKIDKDDALRWVSYNQDVDFGLKEQRLREVIRNILLDEGFGGELPKTEKKEFEKVRKEQSEVLGYKLTGEEDIKEGKLTEGSWKTSKGHGRGQSWMNYDTGKLRLQITKYGSTDRLALYLLPYFVI